MTFPQWEICHVKSDHSLILIQHSLFRTHTRHLRLNSYQHLCHIYSLPQPHDTTAPIRLQVTNRHRSEGGLREGRQELRKNGRVALYHYICTRALNSLYFVHCRAASTVIPIMPMSTFAPLIQPNLALPRTCHITLSTPVQPYGTHPFSSRVQTISILSDPHYSPTPFQFQLFYTHLFIPNSISIRDTPNFSGISS